MQQIELFEGNAAALMLEDVCRGIIFPNSKPIEHLICEALLNEYNTLRSVQIKSIKEIDYKRAWEIEIRAIEKGNQVESGGDEWEETFTLHQQHLYT
jgi:hypothetical protein